MLISSYPKSTPASNLSKGGPRRFITKMLESKDKGKCFCIVPVFLKRQGRLSFKCE